MKPILSYISTTITVHIHISIVATLNFVADLTFDTAVFSCELSTRTTCIVYIILSHGMSSESVNGVYIAFLSGQP